MSIWIAIVLVVAALVCGALAGWIYGYSFGARCGMEVAKDVIFRPNAYVGISDEQLKLKIGAIVAREIRGMKREG